MTGSLISTRAIGRTFRSRIPEPGPLLFLYQTRTLQRYLSNLPSPSDPDQVQNEKSAESSASLKSRTKHSDGEERRFSRPRGYTRRDANFREQFNTYGTDRSYLRDSSFERTAYRRNDSSELPSDNPRPSLESTRTRTRSFEADPFEDEDQSSVNQEEDFVPFESPMGDVAISPVDVTAESSTMTDSERKAFSRLQNLGGQKTQSGQATKKPRTASSRTSFMSLDDVLNEAIANVKAESPSGNVEAEPLVAQGTGAERPDAHSRVQRKPRKDGKNARVDLNQIRQDEIVRIDTLMKNASTDLELWKVLQKEVLDPVRALKLDDDTHIKSDGTGDGRRTHAKPVNRETVMPIFPVLLTRASENLGTVFPASSLVFSIIPEIQRMGPSAYALGASARLFNHSMALSFQKYTDPDAVIELLEEMEKQFIEPSRATLRLLSNIMFTRKKVRSGVYGDAVKMLWETERFKKPLNALSEWKSKVENTIQEQEIRAARQRDASKASEQEMELGDTASVTAS